MKTRLGVHPDSAVRLAALRLGANLNIELVEFSAPDQRTEFPNVSDAGGCHLAIHVDDFEAATTYLIGVSGVELLQPHENGPPGSGAEGGLLSRYFITPFGMHLEIINRPPTQPYEEETDARVFRTDERQPASTRKVDPTTLASTRLA